MPKMKETTPSIIQISVVYMSDCSRLKFKVLPTLLKNVRFADLHLKF